MNDFTTKSQA